MSISVKKKLLSAGVVLGLALLVNTTGNAWHGGGGYHHGPYPQQGGYHHGPGGYYHGGGWNGPSVVIGVPFGGYYGPEYYVQPPVCETVRICNQYHECWLEQECN